MAYTTTNGAHLFGIDGRIERVDWPAIIERVFSDIDEEAEAIEEGNEAAKGVTVLKGHARFVQPKVLEVDGRRLSADQIVIAAELGHFFGSLGTDVTFVVRGQRILDDEDEDVSDRFTRVYQRRFDVALETEIERVRQEDGATVLELSGQAGSRELVVDAVLPELIPMLDAAQRRDIRFTMVNTNGLRIAEGGPWFAEFAARRPLIYLQFDGLTDEIYRTIRGEPLLETKLRAIDRLAQALPRGPIARARDRSAPERKRTIGCQRHARVSSEAGRVTVLGEGDCIHERSGRPACRRAAIASRATKPDSSRHQRPGPSNLRGSGGLRLIPISRTFSRMRLYPLHATLIRGSNGVALVARSCSRAARL